MKSIVIETSLYNHDIISVLLLFDVWKSINKYLVTGDWSQSTLSLEQNYNLDGPINGSYWPSLFLKVSILY